MSYIIRFDRYNGHQVEPDRESCVECDTKYEARRQALERVNHIGDGPKTDYPLCAEDDRPAGDWICGREIGSDGWIEAYIDEERQ